MRRIGNEERKAVYDGFREVLSSLSSQDRNDIYSAVLWFILEGKDSNISDKAKSIIALLRPFLIIHQIKCQGGK